MELTKPSGFIMLDFDVFYVLDGVHYISLEPHGPAIPGAGRVGRLPGPAQQEEGGGGTGGERTAAVSLPVHLHLATGSG